MKFKYINQDNKFIFDHNQKGVIVIMQPGSVGDDTQERCYSFKDDEISYDTEKFNRIKKK